jgi:hypothetical protein
MEKDKQSGKSKTTIDIVCRPSWLQDIDSIILIKPYL